MLTDTHAHLNYEELRDDLPGILERARNCGVERIVTIGTDLESSRQCIALAAAHPEIHATVGFHPTSLPDDTSWEEVRDEMEGLCREPGVAAIGEIGMDYHRLPGQKLRRGEVDVSEALGASSSVEMQADIVDDAYQAKQAEFFHGQLELAKQLGLNVVVHQRDAWNDTLEILTPFDGSLRGVFHCFTNELDQAMDIIFRGHLVSFTGIVTFNNASTVKEVAANVPEDAFMVETDAPYLAPAPHRGKRCEPAHTRLVAEKIAELRNTSLEDIARLTEATANNFFRF